MFVNERAQEQDQVAFDDNPKLIVPVVLSGGGGSRLWPFSTNDAPKQFLPLLGDDKTLFRQTLDRVQDRERFRPPLVVASLRHAELCERELIGEGDCARLILEPFGRNTAPAIVMAAISASGLYGKDVLLLIMPSDHVIERLDEFHAAVAKGEVAARDGNLVTFGIRPSAPDTGYGYLMMGDEIPNCPDVRNVDCFVEKPKQDLAETMVASGDYLWNAGIFLYRADTILAAAERFAPAISQAARAALTAGERDGIRLTAEAGLFADCPSESIDYAVMERASNVAVVPMSPGWSDLGSWDALATMAGAEESVGPITALDCESCYIRSDGVQVAALGVRDLIIVASGGRLLILPRGRSQEVKKLLSAMDSMAA